MPQRFLGISDLEIRYPFAPRSRRFFETVPVEEGLSSGEVVAHAEARLKYALGKARYEPHLSEETEFSSFFIAALVAGQDSFLTGVFAAKESERARESFVAEGTDQKTVVMAECFGIVVKRSSGEGPRALYSTGFAEYLMLVSKYELSKIPRWKLAQQALDRGTVYLSDNLLNELFTDAARGAIAEGARNLRRAAFPKQLVEVRDRVLRLAPPPKARSGKSYAYIEELLKHPTSDGRHRLIWLVLTPYLVNVKKMEDAEAFERMRAFVAVAGEGSDMKRFIQYNVRRAKRNGLMPPTLSKLKSEHPDLYALMPKEALALEPRVQQKKPASK